MRKLIRYDLFRAFHQPSTFVLFAIALVIAMISAAEATFLSEETGGDLLVTFGNALASGKDIILMLAGCMCGMLIGEDFSVGSYSLNVSSGYTRREILCGRTVSYFIVISMMLTGYMIIAALLSMIYVKTFVFSEILRMIALSALHIIHFCMLNMLCVLVCFVLKKKVNATAVCLFLNTIVFALLGTLCTKVELMTPLYMKTVPILTYTMFAGDNGVFTILGSTLVCLVIAIAIFLATDKIFKKEELV